MGYQAVIKDSDVIEGLSIRFLKIFGMWGAINEFRKTGKRNLIIKSYIISCMLITAPTALFQMQSPFAIEYDIEKATYVFIHALPGISCCCRITILWFRLDSQCKLYDLIRNDFFNIPELLRANVQRIYKECNKKSNMFIFFVFMWNNGLIAWFVLFPSASVNYIQHSSAVSMSEVTAGKKKILGSWYPFPVEQYPYYEIVFTYEVVFLVLGATLISLTFALYLQILMCLYAQFVVLGYRLSNLKLDVRESDSINNEKNGPSKSTPRINKELSEMLRDHQKLLRYAEELKSVYNPLVTITLGIGIIILITGALQLLLTQGKKNDLGLLFHFFQIFSFQFTEMALLCYGSSLMETASKDLHFAIYCSDWYKADVKFRKAAQMMMLRAKKGVNLTALIMYPINMETLGSICQFTYSSSALMTGMVE